MRNDYVWLRSLVLAAAGLFFVASGVRADGLEIHPVSMTLVPGKASGVLTLGNNTQEPVRFHMSAQEWKQKPNGQMVLTPTQEIMFFPAMMTLAPGEQRNIRVGTTLKPANVERTFRIFISQLPKLATSQDVAVTTGQVGLATRMSIPVFVEPVSPKQATALSDLVVRGPKVSFAIKSAGNVHFMPKKLVFTARDAKNNPVHQEELAPWYVLAGDIREYAVTLPAAACASSTTLEVEVQQEKGPALRRKLAGFKCAQ